MTRLTGLRFNGFIGFGGARRLRAILLSYDGGSIEDKSAYDRVHDPQRRQRACGCVLGIVNSVGKLWIYIYIYIYIYIFPTPSQPTCGCAMCHVNNLNLVRGLESGIDLVNHN